MNKPAILNNVARTLSRTKIKLGKYSPEILVVGGVIGVVASTVLACRATTKLSEIVEDAKNDIDDIHAAVEHPEELNLKEEYTVEDSKKDLAIVYAQTGIKIAKIYAPAVILGGVSIAAILGGHNILRKRNIALAAAYATLDKSFKDYRTRLVERFGAELDKELKYNIKAKEVEETVEKEDGSTETVKRTASVIDSRAVSCYARFFDDGCKGWDKDPEYNLMFLRQREAEATKRLKADGYLFLNDVYDMLGIPRVKYGQVIGWIYDEKNPIGDNYVDFGIYNADIEKNRDFVNRYERTILLDFNVDGNIYDLI